MKNHSLPLSPKTLLSLWEIIQLIQSGLDFYNGVPKRIYFGVSEYDNFEYGFLVQIPKNKDSLKKLKLLEKYGVIYDILFEEDSDFIFYFSAKFNPKAFKLLFKKFCKHYDPKFYELTQSKIDNKITHKSYDPSNCLLTFLEKKIQLPPNSNQSEMCRLLFQNDDSIDKIWSWDEIIEEWGDEIDDTKEYDRKIYTAGYEINKKVAKMTGIDDLFLLTMKTIHLNPKYISNTV